MYQKHIFGIATKNYQRWKFDIGIGTQQYGYRILNIGYPLPKYQISFGCPSSDDFHSEIKQFPMLNRKI